MISLSHTPRQQWSLAVKVGDFPPEDIIVKAVNHSLEVHAEKKSLDGNSEAEFSHKLVNHKRISVFPCFGCNLYTAVMQFGLAHSSCCVYKTQENEICF